MVCNVNHCKPTVAEKIDSQSTIKAEGKLRTMDFLMVNIYCSLDWIWSHPGNFPMDMSVRMVQVRFNN